MTLYSIRDWNGLFENNRSRTVKDLSWVAIPNRHDGENFSAIMLHPDGAQIFAAWVLMLQVASRCQPRGSLVRDNGKPHSSDSLSVKTRAPKKWFDIAFKFLIDNTDWLESKEVAFDCQQPVSVLTQDCQSGDEGRNGKEGMELNGMERTSLVEKPAQILIKLLNEKTGRQFRETDTNLTLINARLNEPGVDLEGCKKMVERQVKRWKGTDQEEYLRPETLFGKQKFEGYYAAKDAALPERNNGKNTSGSTSQNNVKPDHDSGF